MIPSIIGGRRRGPLDPSLDLNFKECDSVVDNRITVAGGANGYRVNSAGLMVAKTAPCIAFNPVTLAARGLMVREARTNSWFPSTYAGAGWTIASSTATAGAIAGPGGAMTGTHLVANLGSVGYAAKTISFTAGTSYVFTARMKAGVETTRSLLVASAAFLDGINRSVVFDLAAGTISTVTGSGASGYIYDAGGGWYECSMAFTPAVTVSVGPQIRSIAVGDGVKGIYVDMVNVGPGTAPIRGDHIETVGAAVTRTVEQVSMTGTNLSSWLNQAEGTFLFLDAEYAETTTDLTPRLVFGLSVTTSLNDSVYITRSASSAVVSLRSQSGGVSQCNITPGSIVAGTPFNVGFRYRGGEFGASLNGGAIVTATGITPAAYARMGIGCSPANFTGSSLNGVLGRVLYYPRFLEDAEFKAALV